MCAEGAGQGEWMVQQNVGLVESDSPMTMVYYGYYM